MNDPDGLPYTIRRRLAYLKAIACYGIMRPHTIREHYVRDNIDNTHTYKHIQSLESIMYGITHIQSLVHIEVLFLIQWEDESQYEYSFTLIGFQIFKFPFTMGYPFFTFQFINKL